MPVFVWCPYFYTLLSYLLTGLSGEHISSAQAVVHSLQVLEVLAPFLHPELFTQLFSLLPQLLSCLCSQYTAIRHLAARCLSTLAQVQLHTTMQVISCVCSFTKDVCKHDGQGWFISWWGIETVQTMLPNCRGLYFFFCFTVYHPRGSTILGRCWFCSTQGRSYWGLGLYL